MNDNGNEFVRFTLRLPAELGAQVTSDAKDKALTKNALVRMILKEHYARQEAEYRIRRIMPGQITP
jgi:hypothetical protein